MKQTIWYCTEDEMIFPDEETARESYREWLHNKGYNESEFDEVIFHLCYKEITFEDYNKLHED